MPSTPISPSPPWSPTMRPRIAVSAPSRVAPSSRSISWPGAGLAAAKSSHAAEHEPHRPAQRERRRGHQRLGDHQLAAERAAERRRPHAHAVERQPEQRRRSCPAGHERALGAGAGRPARRPARPRPSRTAARGSPGGPSSCGSGRRRRRRRARAPAAASPLASRWRDRDVGRQLVAALPRLAAAGASVCAPAAPSPPPAPRSAGRAGASAAIAASRSITARQRLGVDEHQRRAVLGRRLGLGHHERHRLAGPHDLLARERLGRRGRSRRRSAGRPRSARRRRRAPRAPRTRRSPMIRACASAASTEPGVQQPVQRHVAHVARQPAHLRLAVPAPARHPDRGHAPDPTHGL